MTVAHGSTAALLVDGYSLSGFAKSAQVSSSQDMHDSTVFGATAHSRLPGLRHASLSAEMFFDGTATTGPWDVLKAKYVSETPGVPAPSAITVAPQGLTVGTRVALLYAAIKELQPTMPVDDLSMIQLNAEASEDAVDFGVSLHALTAETSLPFTGTAVDNTAASSNGGVGLVHVTAIAGGAPNAVYLIEHSTDASSWVTLITFAAITTANTVLRTEVAAGTTIRRHLRTSISDGGTTTSVTGSVAFARR